MLVAALAPRPSKSRKGRTYPLLGFLVCGKYGGPLRSLTRENGGRSYECRKGQGMGGCVGIRIQANGLEAYVRDLICGILADPVTRAAMVALAPVTTVGSVSDTLADLQLRRERLIDLYIEGDIDRATFRMRQARIGDQIRVAEGERGGDGRSRPMPTTPSTFDELAITWEASRIDFQRCVIKFLIGSILLHPATARRRGFGRTCVLVTTRK